MDTPKVDVTARLSTAIEEWNAEIVETHAALSRQITAAQQHLDTISSPGGADAAAAADAAEIARLNSALTESEKCIKALESALVEAQSEAALLRSESEAQAVERADAQARMESVQAQYDDLLMQCLEAQEAAETAQQQRMEAQAEAEAARQQLAELEAAAEAAQAPRAEDTSRIAALEEQLEAAEKQNAELEARLGESETRVLELEGQLSAERELAPEPAAAAPDLSDWEAKLAHAQAERDAATAEANRLRQEVAELQARAGAPQEPKPVDISKVQAFDARGHKKRMGQILVEAGVITDDELQGILSQQAAAPQRRFGTLVVEQGHTSEEVVARILAAQLRLPYTELSEEEIDEEATIAIGPHLADLHQCLPLRKEEDRLVLAMANPLDLIAIEDVELATKCRVEPVVAAPSHVRRAIAQYCYRPLE